VIVGAGAGGDDGTGTTTARGTGVVSRADGVSAGVGEACFVFADVRFFLFALAGVSLALDFFFADFGFAVGSGVSFGVAVGLASSGGFLDVVFGLGEGDGVLDLRFGVFGLGDGLGDSSGAADIEARALRNSARFCLSSSLTCARTRTQKIALTLNAIVNNNRKRPTDAQRNRAHRAINSRRHSESAPKAFRPPREDCRS